MPCCPKQAAKQQRVASEVGSGIIENLLQKSRYLCSAALYVFFVDAVSAAE